MKAVFMGKHKRSAVRALEHLLDTGWEVTGVVVPEPVDPEEARAGSTSTTCSRDCRLFQLPMLRSATLSSFPVRRVWIRPG